MTQFSKNDWLIPISLILLSTVPVIGGVLRLYWLSGGAEIIPGNERVLAMPAPAVIHIISSSIFCVLGAFQFSARIRSRNPKWHRTAGRILVLAGLASALSGLWMTQFYPFTEFDGSILYAMRLLVGTSMILFICFGLVAIIKRNFTCHQAWMMRGYALGMGAGTQVLTHIPWSVYPSIQSELTRTLFMGAGWIINLIIVECILYPIRNKAELNKVNSKKLITSVTIKP